MKDMMIWWYDGGDCLTAPTQDVQHPNALMPSNPASRCKIKKHRKHNNSGRRGAVRPWNKRLRSNENVAGLFTCSNWKDVTMYDKWMMMTDFFKTIFLKWNYHSTGNTSIFLRIFILDFTKFDLIFPELTSFSWWPKSSRPQVKSFKSWKRSVKQPWGSYGFPWFGWGNNGKGICMYITYIIW